MYTPTPTPTEVVSSRPAGSPGRRPARSVRRAMVLPGLLLAGTALLAACGDDDDTASALEDGVLEVTLTDFSFGELPESVPAGTRVEIENAADAELHEFVAVRLPDGDERPLEEIVPAGLEQLFTSGPPTAVLLAAPGEEQIPAVGDGTLTEPGRYVIVCMIPTGVDPQAYFEAAQASGDGPPQIENAGPPHVMNGMYAELVVTDA